ncbi:EscU/YscU/HrcU family type III secretion system export apparatus switch protein [Treponema berlinense]|uniref:EscU/YscU/HrcU family type III secretion system export apparatus switch protein n=1 Tax=Treponema berlinense TaxID=225004 RepID=UPI00235426EE|nr:EscU/YscU/HrcU family type III secretion system export apparatus switch protein [Treponema berlinense]
MEKKQKAVCLKYPENAAAPFIAAKGQGFAAEKMLEIARQNKIPVVENENLANVLSVENIGQLIPESLYEAVASIFAFISSTERKM